MKFECILSRVATARRNDSKYFEFEKDGTRRRDGTERRDECEHKSRRNGTERDGTTRRNGTTVSRPLALDLLLFLLTNKQAVNRNLLINSKILKELVILQ